LHDENLNDFYFSSNIVQKIQSDYMGRACGAHGEKEKSVRNLKEKDICKDLGVDGIIIL
jgi:hypothetical protein